MPARKKSSNMGAIGKRTLSSVEGLATAMQTELEGFEFYKLTAARTKDEGARDMFESLARDETEHHRILKSQYESFATNGKFLPFRKSNRSRLNFKSPIFSREFLESRKKKNFEMSALSIGILLEQDAIRFFREQAELSDDLRARRLFSDLADWEGEHLRALLAQKTFLQREIFSRARFEPF